MPRVSPEATAAAAFRTGSEWPKPPAVLPARAKQVWREIVFASAPDRYFGLLHALQSYCCAVAERERTSAALATSQPGSVESSRLVKAVKQLSDQIAREGRGLRIHLSNRLDRKSGVLNGEGPGPALVVDNRDDDRMSLIGGRAIRPQWD